MSVSDTSHSECLSKSCSVSIIFQVVQHLLESSERAPSQLPLEGKLLKTVNTRASNSQVNTCQSSSRCQVFWNNVACVWQAWNNCKIIAFHTMVNCMLEQCHCSSKGVFKALLSKKVLLLYVHVSFLFKLLFLSVFTPDRAIVGIPSCNQRRPTEKRKKG